MSVLDLFRKCILCIRQTCQAFQRCLKLVFEKSGHLLFLLPRQIRSNYQRQQRNHSVYTKMLSLSDHQRGTLGVTAKQ